MSSRGSLGEERDLRAAGIVGTGLRRVGTAHHHRGGGRCPPYGGPSFRRAPPARDPSGIPFGMTRLVRVAAAVIPSPPPAPRSAPAIWTDGTGSPARTVRSTTA